MLSEEERGEVTAQLAAFVERVKHTNLLSTGARVVDLVEPLYNVSGSTDDPEIDGKNWLDLLASRGVLGDCYADTPAAPTQSSHYKDDLVGGHMTLNADGSVERGGLSYLMPLCKWHNHPARNRIKFHHTRTRMLELSGYMEGQPAMIFMALQEPATDLSVVFMEPDGLTYRNVPDQASAVKATLLSARLDGLIDQPPFVLLRRHGGAAGRDTYTIEDTNL